MAITVNVSTSLILLLFVTRGVVADFGPECPYTLETRAGAGYYTLPVLVGAGGSQRLVLSVRGCGPVYLRLTAGQQGPGSSENYAEIMLDDRLNASTLANSTDVLDSYTGPLLSCTEFRTFAVAFNFGGVIVSKGKVVTTESERVLQTFDTPDFPGLFAKYISVRSEGESHYWNFGQQDGSHGLIPDTRDGVVTSPNYGQGSEYPPNTDCQWVIVTSLPHTTVGLDYIDFVLQGPDSSSNCLDKVTVRHAVQDVPQTVHCGSDAKPRYRSDSDIVHLSFSSDGQTEGRGFVMKFFQAYTDVIYQYGEGFISSPNYPFPYPPYAEISWYVFLGANYSVTLTFRDFDLEDKDADGSCSADVITMYGGPRSISSPELGRFCGQTLPGVVNSGNASIILIKMTSDAVTEGRGFLVQVSIGGCIEMMFGDFCNESCACDVNNTLSCDSTNGTCYCKAGWEGVTCEDDVDECNGSLHNCTGDHEECLNTIGGFGCDCQIGYVYDGSGVCQECNEGVFGQHCNTSCNCDMTHTLSCGHVNGTCYCKAGWEGVTCEDDVDECNDSLHNCTGDQQECVNTIGGFVCVCQPGYVLDNNSVCQDCSEGTFGPNCNSSCSCDVMTTESCDHLNGTCYCKAGWEGVTCEDDVDECNRSLHNCTGDHRECANLIGGFQCFCQKGYFLDRNIVCQACPCDVMNTESCDRGNGSCYCKAGWEGVTCEDDVDECNGSLHNCTGDQQECVNTIGGFECNCHTGFLLDNGGVCLECMEGMYGQHCNASCECDVSNTESCDHVNGTCYCKAGWEGVTCDISVVGCNCTGEEELCVRGVAGIECACKLGFAYNNRSVCQECPEGQFGQNCSNTCNCNSTNTESCDRMNGTCYCKAGWEGVTCDDDVRDCKMNPLSCSGPEEECVEAESSFVCRCEDGYFYNTSGLCQDSDECAVSGDNRCSGQCVNTEGAFTCTCDTGYNVDDAGGCHAAPYKLVIGLAVGIPAAIILVGFAIGVAIAAIKRRTRSAESDKGENPHPPRDGQPGEDSNTGGSTGYFTRSSSVDSWGMYRGNAARFQAVSSPYKEMYRP
ncbi:fibropellin-1-like [Littorina saxatilis]|uniref:fibropellin-1-like n=1 Tax=Littorina saxatilis TaxID=31220 RepID=UPI0038B4A87A